jgi:hypothetical protein
MVEVPAPHVYMPVPTTSTFMGRREVSLLMIVTPVR